MRVYREACLPKRSFRGGEWLASEEMVEFSASGAPERPTTSLAQARGGDEVAIGTVG
jgi:hypothetical protein